MSKILFIEDNKTKTEDVKTVLAKIDIIKELVIKTSFTSGLKEFFTNDYDILLLDMSLPTREDIFSNSIDNFEQLGGYKIMSEMKRKNKKIPTILITMFSEFGIGKSFMDVNELDGMLNENFNDFYKGYIYYSSQQESWKKQLTLSIKDIL